MTDTLANLVNEKVTRPGFKYASQRNEELYLLRQGDVDGWVDFFWNVTRWEWYDEDQDGDIAPMCELPSREEVLEAYHARRGQRLSYKTRRKMQRVAKRAS